MRLYLVRHGEAIPEEVDPTRPLTVKGSAEVGRIARFAHAASVRIPLIWHSGKLRTRQTAELLASALEPAEGMQQVDGLSLNDPVELTVQALGTRETDLMIVGHFPFPAKLISMLLYGAPADMIAFEQAGIVCLERKEGRRCHLAWMVTPALIKGSPVCTREASRRERENQESKEGETGDGRAREEAG